MAVALHPEGVDRNCDYHFNTDSRDVALHPEGVDRNLFAQASPHHFFAVALHPEGVDRNQIPRHLLRFPHASPSTRRAWIEILDAFCCGTPHTVALHPEGVDRNNYLGDGATTQPAVALHPEGVDRNTFWTDKSTVASVALHPEGVDRNIDCLLVCYTLLMSPSTRRAWIEIEAVKPPNDYRESPSTRRAWIEMRAELTSDSVNGSVALHPEGVDRNLRFGQLNISQKCRPPPGGRG